MKAITGDHHEADIKWDQSKRVLQYIKDRYNAEPEFLWSSLPECAALRVPGKKPWFAVIGRVPKDKFGLDAIIQWLGMEK